MGTTTLTQKEGKINQKRFGSLSTTLEHLTKKVISSSFINVPPFSLAQNISETEILSKNCIIPKKLQKQKVVFTNIKGESRHNTLASSYIYETNVIFLLSADDYSSALLTAIHSDVNSQRNVYAAQKKKLLSFKSLPQWLFISRSRNALNIYMGKFTYAFLLLSVQFWCRLNCASLKAWHRSHTYIYTEAERSDVDRKHDVDTVKLRSLGSERLTSIPWS